MGAQVRILGPIEVELAGGRRADVPRGRTLAFLALLLTRHGAALHVDRIVDELWEQRAPQHARAAVQVLASRLRAAAGDDLVAYEGGGYAARPAELDADRFEAAARRGREQLAGGDPAAAAATLRGALELWRGAALADVGDARFAQPEIARLEELRLACLGDRVEADLALGPSAAVAAELDALVREHPLDERLRGLQMTALYHAGRQADALAAYRDARRALVEGLGVEPSPRLRELEAAILRQDLPAPARPPAAARAAARRWVTCVFAQTAGPALDPETLQSALERFHAVAERTCGRHRGRVVELRGDAVVAVFGIPAAHEDDAQRAIAAATELVASARLPFGLGVRCGACTGEVLTAGDDHVVGEAIAVAERLGRDAGQRRGPARGRHLARGRARRPRVRPPGRQLAAARDRRRRARDPPPARPAARRPRARARAAAGDVRARREPRRPGDPHRARRARDRQVAARGGAGRRDGDRAHRPLPGARPGRVAVAAARGGRAGARRPDVGGARGRPRDPAGSSPAGRGGRRPGGRGRRRAASSGRSCQLLGALARERPLALVVDDAHRAEPALLDLLTAVLAALGAVPCCSSGSRARTSRPRARRRGTELVLTAAVARRQRVADRERSAGAGRPPRRGRSWRRRAATRSSSSSSSRTSASDAPGRAPARAARAAGGAARPARRDRARDARARRGRRRHASTPRRSRRCPPG